MAIGEYVRTVRRPLLAGGLARARLKPLDERMVFVCGSPRSGTTFVARSIGAIPAFVDLGEVVPLKSAIPVLVAADARVAAERIRKILTWTRRLALVGERRAVEQTPETAFVLRAVTLAFPRATVVHALRDGRDVVCSLLERGWLSREREGADDARASYGPHARFWVEPGREEEFAAASDARRAAWAWRRYVEAVRGAGEPLHEVRYELLASKPDEVAESLAAALDVPAAPLAARLRGAHARSVGRYRRDLTPEQLADVEDEAGALLARLGYA